MHKRHSNEKNSERWWDFRIPPYIFLRTTSEINLFTAASQRERERKSRHSKSLVWKIHVHVQVEQSKCVYWCFIVHQLSQQTRQFPSWKTDNRCPPYEMFMMSASLDLPGAMRLTGWSQPISCSWLHFHYLCVYPRIYRTAGWKGKKKKKTPWFRAAFSEPNWNSSTFLNANMSPGASACFVGFDVRFWMSRTQRN